MLTKSIPVAPIRKAGRPMTMPNDEQLLHRIAAQRDREAFQGIYDRIGAKAFSLAYYLAGNREKAEEAVQDAMLTVWQKADRFEPARGSAKAWILRIVANNIIHAVRKERSEKKREMTLHVESKGDAAPAQAGEGQHEALLDAVREKFAELPDAFRQVLALYFAAEMTQEEISQVLAIPQSTISIRIRQGLEELRRQLKGAGYAAALPLIGTKGLGDLLLSGVEVPAGLGARLMHRLGPAAGHSARAIVASKGAGGLWVAAALVTAAVGGGSWWAMKDGKEIGNSNRSPVKQAGPIGKSEDLSPVTGRSRLRSRTWTFKDGIPADLLVLYGDWKVQRDLFGTEPLLTIPTMPKGWPGLLALPVIVGDKPFCVTIKEVWRTIDEKTLLFFSDTRSLFQGQGWLRPMFRDPRKLPLVLTTRYWYFDGYLISETSDQVVSVMRFTRSSGFGNRLLLSGSSKALQSLAFRDISESEIPEYLRDVGLLIGQFEKEGIQALGPKEGSVTPLPKEIQLLLIKSPASED